MKKEREWVINRKQYKAIKRMDHQQMDGFIGELVQRNTAVTADRILEVAGSSIQRALDETKGIGPKMKAAFLENFQRILDEEDGSCG